MKIEYTVLEVNGDYALVLSESGNENTIALALLPENLEEGDKVVFEDFVYRKN